MRQLNYAKVLAHLPPAASKAATRREPRLSLVRAFCEQLWISAMTVFLKSWLGASGASDRIRTRDHRFTRAALYQLSYRGMPPDGDVGHCGTCCQHGVTS